MMSDNDKDKELDSLIQNKILDIHYRLITDHKNLDQESKEILYDNLFDLYE